MVDLKRTERIRPLAFDTEFRHGGKVEFGYVSNLSEGGVFLATEELIPVGEMLHLRFVLPWQLGEVEAEAQVKWRTYDAGSRAQHLPSGLGLAFVELAPDVRKRLDLYIQRFYQLVNALELGAATQQGYADMEQLLNKVEAKE
jgi:Tfp pilus assembly protein PilZ